jgi:hypothetical protein
LTDRCIGSDSIDGKYDVVSKTGLFEGGLISGSNVPDTIIDLLADDLLI